jgi:uncharacterized membrane protein
MWWAKKARGYRVVYIILAATMAVSILTAFSILVMPKPAENYTEFYILGSEGLAESYPREIAAGQVITVTTGIINHESDISFYHILIIIGDKVVGQAGPLVLEDTASWEQPMQFSVPTVGDDQQVIFTLERNGHPSPYRTLRLWINVKPPKAPKG